MWSTWLNFVLGAWLIIASFIPGIVGNKTASLWNDLIVGILVAIFAYFSTRAKKSMCWINFIAGLWMIVAAFIPGIVASKSGNFWNDLIVGIVIVVVAVWASLAKPSEG